MGGQQLLWKQIARHLSSHESKMTKLASSAPVLLRRRERNRDEKDDSKYRQNFTFMAIGIASAAAAAPFALSDSRKTTKHEEIINHTAGKRVKNLPTYRLEDVKAHKTVEKGVWMIFGEGVYDVTEFVENHPGGKTVMLAAGGDVGPYWNTYSQHHTEQVYDMLEEYRIGNLHPEDVKKLNDTSRSVRDAYSNDPKRHPALLVRQQKPFNAETPPLIAVQNQITPQPFFFVRNHMPVPDIKAEDYRLHIGVDRKTSNQDKDDSESFLRSLTLDDLKEKFKPKTVEATIQCSGNRRDDFNKLKEVKGLKWSLTAISNGTWTGVLLRDVLLSLGLSEEEMRLKYSHVHFEGYDSSDDGTAYEASIPLHKALSPEADVLLAWALNDETLSRDHGYPIRVVVPGVVGARCVKWLKKITVSDEESRSHWQQKDYRMFHSSINWSNVDWSKSPSVQECPVQCAICIPSSDSSIKLDSDFEFKGYAYSGGGKGIVRVDISLDGGDTWHQTDLEDTDQKAPNEYGWRLWSFNASPEMLKKSLRGKSSELELVVKATDSSHNVMPKDAQDVWNIRGIMNNSWHRIKIKVQN